MLIHTAFSFKSKAFFSRLFHLKNIFLWHNRNMRLLVAEDEKSLSRALKTILERNNYTVDAVYNGPDAITYIENTPYDAVILDIMMPGLDGINVLKEIRRNGNGVPVLVLSAKAEIDDKVLGLDSGANDYLTKPFDVKELLARLRVLTRVSSKGEADKIERGNIKLDLKSFELSSQKGTFRLTNKEFQIAQIFFQRPDEIISADFFLDHIWGYDTSSDISTVWVYISYLRKKLSSLGANIEIKAARNVGYYLEVGNEK